ncbi:MAG TPA: cupin domain-containing protein [Gaiellales bacterium]|jgi:mannose-6-phosphate isomerase-like protein (cupin superfamily)
MTGEGPFAAALAGRLIAAPSASIVLAEWADPGGGDPPRYIAPLHVHHEDDEAWYVVEGALVVRSGDTDLQVPAGGAAIVPRGTPHTYWNPLPRPTRYVLVMTPRIRALIDALHALDERTSESVAAVFGAHRSEYLGWP